MEVSALLILADVCGALGLTAAERQQVLGAEAAQFLRQWADTPVRLNGKGGPGGQSRRKRG